MSSVDTFALMKLIMGNSLRHIPSGKFCSKK